MWRSSALNLIFRPQIRAEVRYYATWRNVQHIEVIHKPTYFCRSASGRLTAEQKKQIAGEITRVHREVTGAPSFFAQVIFHEVNPTDWFMGGLPLTHEHILVYGHIRAGCVAVDKTHMIKLRVEAIALAAQVKSHRAVWVYFNELPPRQMIEFGHLLPEPGGEPSWMAALLPEVAPSCNRLLNDVSLGTILVPAPCPRWVIGFKVR
jgi:phenylpyruvate tautomerase PptA (4-oxalocrotonate tautomerase family)